MEIQEIVTLVVSSLFLIAIAISEIVIIEKDSKKEVDEKWLWFLPPRH